MIHIISSFRISFIYYINCFFYISIPNKVFNFFLKSSNLILWCYIIKYVAGLNDFSFERIKVMFVSFSIKRFINALNISFSIFWNLPSFSFCVYDIGLFNISLIFCESNIEFYFNISFVTFDWNMKILLNYIK